MTEENIEEQASREFGLPAMEPGDIKLEQVPSDAMEIPTDEVFVNLILDKDEGVPVDRGRYTTWYCFYLVHKAWMEDEDNRKKLARKIPVFALANYPTPPFHQETLKEETWEWMQENWDKYYQVIPITNLYGGEFKTVGCKIPKQYPRKIFGRSALTDETGVPLGSLNEQFSLEPGEADWRRNWTSPILLVSIFGTWYSGRSLSIPGLGQARESYEGKWSVVARHIEECLAMTDPDEREAQEEGTYETV